MLLVVGITGASGAIYGIRLLQVLSERKNVETHLIISGAAEKNINYETDWKIEDVKASLAAALKKREGAEPYAVTGSAFSGALNVSFGANRLFGQFWPHNELAR